MNELARNAPPVGKPTNGRAMDETKSARIWEEAKAKGASPEAKEATAKARPWQPVNPGKRGSGKPWKRKIRKQGQPNFIGIPRGKGSSPAWCIRKEKACQRKAAS